MNREALAYVNKMYAMWVTRLDARYYLQERYQFCKETAEKILEKSDYGPINEK